MLVFLGFCTLAASAWEAIASMSPGECPSLGGMVQSSATIMVCAACSEFIVHIMESVSV